MHLIAPYFKILTNINLNPVLGGLLLIFVKFAVVGRGCGADGTCCMQSVLRCLIRIGLLRASLPVSRLSASWAFLACQVIAKVGAAAVGELLQSSYDIGMLCRDIIALSGVTAHVIEFRLFYSPWNHFPRHAVIARLSVAKVIMRENQFVSAVGDRLEAVFLIVETECLAHRGCLGVLQQWQQAHPVPLHQAIMGTRIPPLKVVALASLSRRHSSRVPSSHHRKVPARSCP